MSLPKHKPAGSTSSMYSSHPPSLSSEYINIAPSPLKPQDKSQMFSDEGGVTTRPSITYLPPPFPPPSYDPTSTVRQTFLQRNRRFINIVAYFIMLILVTFALAVPVFLWRGRWAEERKGAEDLRLHLAIWIFASWAFFMLSNLLINLLPYVFKIYARLFNPGWIKYWRVFRFMRFATTMLGGILGMYCSFIIHNDKALFKKGPKKPDAKSMDWDDILKNLAINANKKLKKPSEAEWNKIINDILTMAVVWAVLFFLEQAAMLFVSIHYHYRADGIRIDESKRRRNALLTLYEASISLYAPFQEEFRSEDAIIRNGKGTGKGKFLSKFSSSNPKVIVDHALEDQRSSAAMAKRIWMSLVPEGRDTLTAQDVIEVLGTHRRVEAEEAFANLDKNENGDINLNEMVLIVLETGRTRRVVYQGMTDINRAINVLDWMFRALITMAVVIFGIVRYIPSLAKMKDAAGFAALGLTWGLGRSLYEFINGVIFIFFKHAYDVGDRVEVYNMAATNSVPVTVKRVSLLFTVFRRVDNGKDLQIGNDRLALKRLENVSRSGANREEVSVIVDFNTTFADIQHLKLEIQRFLTSRENKRDYQPDCDVRVGSIYEMNKLELKVKFTHKSNWSNEELRAARSSKFMCALVAAIRRLSTPKPGSIQPVPVRQDEFEERSEQAAFRDLTVIPVTSDELAQESNVATGAEIGSWIGQASTGLRRRTDQTNGGVYFGT
ncbi:hypothetical protein MMC34_002764 [Xylographa carneopallida]|nr:hypothetical protein [Xylographa carneopallida]